MPKAIAAVTTQDIRTIASSLSLQGDASKQQILDAVRGLDPKKGADTIRLIALTLGMAAASTRDEVLAALEELLEQKDPSATELLRQRAHRLVEKSGGELTFSAAVDVIVGVFPHAAAAARRDRYVAADAAARRIRDKGQPATDELSALIRARMSEAKVDWLAAFSAVAQARPELIARVNAERDEQRVATSA